MYQQVWFEFRTDAVEISEPRRSFNDRKPATEGHGPHLIGR